MFFCQGCRVSRAMLKVYYCGLKFWFEYILFRCSDCHPLPAGVVSFTMLGRAWEVRLCAWVVVQLLSTTSGLTIITIFITIITTISSITIVMCNISFMTIQLLL